MLHPSTPPPGCIPTPSKVTAGTSKQVAIKIDLPSQELPKEKLTVSGESRLGGRGGKA